MIELKNVSKYYSNDGLVTLGLRNINLKLYKNEIVAIIGDSGSGKSTLLNVICGVDTYEDGEMYFKGNETSYFNQNDMDQYRKKNVGFIYQNYNIIDAYTVLDNVMLPMILNGVDKQEAKKRAIELIEKVGLSHRIKNRGTNLSGGEKQRCVIARALAADCDILACDEPTGNLDSKSGAEIINLIKEVAKDKLVLIVTHNYEEVEDIVTRRIKVADGTIVEDHVIKEVKEEINEELDIEEDLISKKNLFKIAFKNIKSTPRKSMFTFMLFFIVSLLAFYLYLSCTQSAQVSVFNPDSSFNNYEYNRMIAFDYAHGILDDDYKNIKGTIYENAFYEDIPFKATIERNRRYAKDITVVYSNYDMSFELVKGRKLFPTTSREVFIILPKDQLDKYSLQYSSYVGDDMILFSYRFAIVGMGSSEYVSYPTIITSTDITDQVIGITYQNYVSLDITIPQLEQTFKVSRKNMKVTYPTLYVPINLKDYVDDFQYNYVLNELYPIITPKNIEIRYVYGNINYSFFFCMPENYVYEFDGVYEATIYAEKPNEAFKTLEGLGYTVIRPSVDFQEVSQNQVLFIAYVAISTIIIFVVVFISQAILSRIYLSKNKDYAVLRSLGVVKKNMSRIVDIEIISVSFAASIIAFIFTYAAYFIFKLEYMNVIVYNNFGLTMLYFMMMLLFSMYISNRFNKRLFKFSVQTTFKGEVIKND